MIGNKIFIGEEVEGPNRGRKTMFFPKGSVVPAIVPKLIEILNKIPVNRLYFGAGDRTGITKEEYDFILFINSTFPDFHFTFVIEFTEEDLKESAEYLEDLVDIAELVFVVRNPFLTFPVSSMKFVDEKYVQWHSISAVHTTAINDALYENDKIIDL